jgi:hypothetical protein
LIIIHLQNINWDELAAKQIAAPFKPRIRDELDVSNFSEEFTDLAPLYSPAAVPKTADRVFRVSEKKQYLFNCVFFSNNLLYYY